MGWKRILGLALASVALALVAVTPLALLMVHLAVPAPTTDLLADRGVETVIGVGAGLLVGYLTRVRYPRS